MKVAETRLFLIEILWKNCFLAENIRKMNKKVTNCLAVSEKSITFADK